MVLVDPLEEPANGDLFDAAVDCLFDGHGIQEMADGCECSVAVPYFRSTGFLPARPYSRPIW
jgi:hypothetical protein